MEKKPAAGTQWSLNRKYCFHCGARLIVGFLIDDDRKILSYNWITPIIIFSTTALPLVRYCWNIYIYMYYISARLWGGHRQQAKLSCSVVIFGTTALVTLLLCNGSTNTTNPNTIYKCSAMCGNALWFVCLTNESFVTVCHSRGWRLL